LPVTPPSTLVISTPDWLEQAVDWNARYRTDDERMRVVVELAGQSVSRGWGGPFGAGVFEGDGGRLVAAGVNSVSRLNNSVLHAETLAIMLAQARLGTYAIGEGDESYLLVTSCEPCAMCLGATLWSGVRGLVCGATREDAMAVGFDEGPVFAQSWVYLEQRGVRTARGVLRDQAVAVLERYRDAGGAIYSS
jgi:tRNA(Arg) A34 adenosine deaminase TadA